MQTHPISAPDAVASGERQPKTTLGLVRSLVADLSMLFRQEVALARAEVADSLSAAKKGAASIALGGAVLFAGLMMLLAAAVLVLAEVMAAWVAALIVGVL